MGSPLSLLRGAHHLLCGLSLSAADLTATCKVYQPIWRMTATGANAPPTHTR